jgi:iron complex transport system substrate-binding protein
MQRAMQSPPRGVTGQAKACPTKCLAAFGGACFSSPKRAILLAVSLVLAAAAPAPPHRIVSLSPNLTEILYGIGAFPQVAGVTDYCTYPPEVKKLPSVGGWDGADLEKLLALRPDLVVVDDAEAPFIADKVKALGFPLLVVPNHTVADVYTGMAELGHATGHEAGAHKLIAETRDALARISRQTAALARPGVLIVVDRTPGTLRELYTATPGGFLAELVTIAGGRNAAPPHAGGYGKLSQEDLLAINPDVILDCIHGTDRRSNGAITVWQQMPELKAVRARRVYGLDQDYVPHASQRMVETAALIARLIHPEAK